MINIEAVRKETYGCTNVIHLNNAGASLMPKAVTDVLHHYLKIEESIGGYETAAFLKDELNNFYTSISKLLNCTEDEIAYVENATRGWDIVFYSFRFERGDKIITSLAEYGSNIISYLQQSKKYGVEIEFVPNDSYGQLDVTALEKMIDNKVKLISISHIPTGGGLVNPAAEVGKIANKYKIPYLLDACQSVGQIPLDVKEIGCDFLSGTGRKYLRGPRGTGLLYIKKSMIEKMEPQFLDLHAAKLCSVNEYEIRADAKRFENWEQNFAGKAALGKAVDYALSIGLENIKDRVFSLANLLREKLNEVDGITVADTGLEKCGIVTFYSSKISTKFIKEELSKHKINVSTSSGSGNLVLFQQEGYNELVRASLHYYNTEEEIEIFLSNLKTF